MSTVRRYPYLFGTVIALVASACVARSSTMRSSALSALPTSVDVKEDCGAVGDGIADDRGAIQACLSSGASDVFVPNGVYLVGTGVGFCDLSIPSGVTLHGESRSGAVIIQAPAQPGSVRLIGFATCQSGPPETTGVSIRDLTLDGNKTAQTVDEHRAGIFASNARGLRLERVTARNFTGDGFYLYNGSNDAVVDDVAATDNDRNGITFGGGTISGVVTRSYFAGNRAQQVDSEPGANGFVNGLDISGCTLDGLGVSNDYALTISGGSSTSRSSRWRVHDNTINGGIFVVWSDDIEIRGNRGVNPTTKPAVTLWRTTNRVSVVGNRWMMTQNAVDSLSAVYIAGTGVGSVSSRAYIADNELSVLNRAKSFGVRAEGFRDAIIDGNMMLGPGIAGGYPGILLRTTIVGEDIRSAVVRRNRVYDWGGMALTISGNGPAVIRLIDISDNVFDDSAGSMSAGMSLDDGTGCARDVRQSGNLALGGVATMVSRAPQGAWSTWGSGDRWLKP